ncbi:hypothetical protein ONS95_001897 [Cadophora gregata]|uniref:uncharacterized protein n=1 Tax=Cadophora gregata TaxID=51156 RepID=UPI0026DB4EF5|nr:uncharacterized protein ONS95_001897 [Cadophora gregata]KAK0111544.1 hypothetical protein ONS95_001897 [Cadophora gregata]KAK0111980.1 hypothetical protein ONS96_001242 [Cadophora gregata f. sp. sojae]
MTSPQEILAAAKDKDFKLAGCGLFAQVLVLLEPGIALKICDEPGEASEVEIKIYERLGLHPRILTTYGECESEAGKGLALEYLPAGPVVQHLALEKYSEERQRWPAQVIEAVQYIHSKGIVHCDIGAHNFMVSKDGSLVLADFCGSSLDGSRAIVAPSIRYCRPVPMEQRSLNICVKDDSFAVGVVLYEIAVGSRVLEAKDDRDVTRLYEKGEFPNLEGIEARLAKVIKKCWEDRYESADEIQADYAGM